MDLVVVSETRGWGFAVGGPLVVLEDTGCLWQLASLCFCVWVFGLCCGCLCRRPVGGHEAPATRAPPAQLAPSARWARVARRAINFVRSRRRLSLAFAHLGTYSVRKRARVQTKLEKEDPEGLNAGPDTSRGPCTAPWIRRRRS